MDFKDYYKILGVSRDADADRIRQSYRRLARRYHPDVSKEADAEDHFKELQEAYEVLRDPEKRQAYDQFGQYWKQGMEQGATGAGAGTSQTRYRQEGFNPEGFADFEDFISSLFGERGFGQRRSARRRGGDEHARLDISLEEAFHGTTRTLSFDVLEPAPQGRIHSRKKTLNVTIPAGVTDGQRIRLAGQGQPGGDEPGDLYIELHIQPHPKYKLSGRNLYLDVPVTPWEAALGEKINLKTLGGTVKLAIPAGSQSGSKLKLSGRGLPGKPAGDLYAVLQIVAPAPRTEADRELYRTLAEAMPMDPRQG